MLPAIMRSCASMVRDIARPTASSYASSVPLPHTRAQYTIRELNTARRRAYNRSIGCYRRTVRDVSTGRSVGQT
eukprot:3810132-Rhodomonas_salina.1